MKKGSKLLALLLAVTMIVTLLPVTVFADEAPAEAAEPAAVEEIAETAEAPAEETPAEAPAEEAKPEETPAEPAAEETPAAETAPIVPETAQKEEPLVFARSLETVPSGSEYATFTRETLSGISGIGPDGAMYPSDEDARNAGFAVRTTDSSGAIYYYETLSTATLKAVTERPNSGRTVTLIDDVVTSTDTALNGTADGWGNAYFDDLTIDLNGYTWTVNTAGKALSSSLCTYTLKNGRIITPANTNTPFNIGASAGSAVGKAAHTVNYENLVISCQSGFLCAYAFFLTVNITDSDIWCNNRMGAVQFSGFKSAYNNGVMESCLNVEHSFIGCNFSKYPGGSFVDFISGDHVSRVISQVGVNDSTICIKGDLTSATSGYNPTAHVVDHGYTTTESVAYTPYSPYDEEVTGLTVYEGDVGMYFDFNANAEVYTVTFVDDDGTTVLNTVDVEENTGIGAYAAPAKGDYVFDYWTVEGDETHYTAGSLSSYIVTQAVTFTAHYRERVPTASFTPDGGEETIYDTFQLALAASNAANGAGVITLYDDVIVPDGDAYADSRTFSMTTSLNIDFNGHYILSTRGNVFHIAAANVTLDFRNGAIIGGSTTNAGYAVSMGGANNATVYLTDMDLYNINGYSTAGTTINLQGGTTEATKGILVAENCRFFAKSVGNTMTVYGASSSNATRFIDAIFTDCTFVTTSATSGNAIGDYHVETDSLCNLTFSGVNTYYSRYSSPAMCADKEFFSVDTEDCGFALTKDETFDNTDRYATTADKAAEMLNDPTLLTGMYKLTQTPAVTVTFFDDNDELITTQLVPVGSSPSAYAAPVVIDGSSIKTFDYWTVEGDDDTHYTAEDLARYIINDETAFYAHYTVTAAVASYTDDEGNVTYYSTLEAAIVASCAANASSEVPLGKVTLLQDYTNDSYVGKSNTAYTNRISVSIEIDFGGHTYNTPHMSAFMFLNHARGSRMTVKMYNGNIVGMQENFKPGETASTHTGHPMNCAGALINFNSAIHDYDFILTDLNIICLSPNGSYALSLNEPQACDRRCTFTMNNCTVMNTMYPDVQISATSYTDFTFNGTTFVSPSEKYNAFYVAANCGEWTITLDSDCEYYGPNQIISPAHAAYGVFTEPADYALQQTGTGYALGSVITDSDLLAEALATPTYTGTVAEHVESTVSAWLADAPHYEYAQAATITWMFGDDVVGTQTVAYGDTPTAPTASELAAYAFDTLVGWTDTQGSSDPIEIPTVTGDATYYAVASVNTAPTAETKVGMQLGTDAMYYYTTLTRAMTIAMAQSEPVVIDLLANITMDHSTDECGTTSATANFWFVFPAGMDLTLNLNGFTLSGGTDDTMYSSSYAYRDRGLLMAYCNTNDFSFSLTIVGGEGETKGTLMTTGQRNVLGFATTDNSVSCAQVDFNATNVVFRRTSREFTNYLVAVNAHTDTHSVSFAFTNCEFVEESPIINNAIVVSNAANIGDTPAILELNNCSFSGIKYAVGVYRDAVGSHPNKTTPQITVDTATAQNIISEMDGMLSQRIFLSKAVVGAAELLVIDPATVERVYTPIFKLDQISMSLQDYVYVNVKPNDAWTTEYCAVTSLTGDEPISGTGELQIENLPITAKEMDQNVIYTIFADADATTRYLSGTVGSIDSFATKTADAADAATEKGAALITAMSALKKYGDWAAYNFDTTGEISAPAAVEYDVSGIDAITFVGSAKPAAGVAGLYGVSSVLSDQLYLKYYFYNVADLADKTTVTPSDAVAAEYGTDGSGNYSYVKLKIMPKYFDTDYTVSVSDGGKTYAATGGLAAYAAMLTEQGTEKEQTLAKALLAYCAAVKTYFELG